MDHYTVKQYLRVNEQRVTEKQRNLYVERRAPECRMNLGPTLHDKLRRRGPSHYRQLCNMLP